MFNKVKGMIKGISPLATKELLNTAKQSTISSLAYATLNPEILIAYIIPLYTVTKYDSAVSQDILKYRAIGAQYLAKQSGGNYSLRIDAILEDNSVGAYTLTMIEGLFIYGEAKLTSLLKFNDIRYAENFKLAVPQKTPDEVVYKSDDISWATSKDYKTCCIQGRDEILYSMHLESFIYWRDIEKDKNKIIISLLFRKFSKPPLLDIKPATIELDNIDVAGSKLVNGRNLLWVIYQQQQSYIVKYIPSESPYIDYIETIISAFATYQINASKGYSPLNIYKSKDIRDKGLLQNKLIEYSARNMVNCYKLYHLVGDSNIRKEVNKNLDETSTTLTADKFFVLSGWISGFSAKLLHPNIASPVFQGNVDNDYVMQTNDIINVKMEGGIHAVYYTYNNKTKRYATSFANNIIQSKINKLYWYIIIIVVDKISIYEYTGEVIKYV